MAPARSIQCIRRPPSSAASGLASFGSTISAISDCESRTGRGSSESSVIVSSLSSKADCLASRQGHAFFFKYDSRKHSAIFWMRESSCRRSHAALRQIKFQIAMCDRPVISLANISKNQHDAPQRSPCFMSTRPQSRGAETANRTASQTRSCGDQLQLLA